MYAQLYGRKTIEADPLRPILQLGAEGSSRRLPICPLLLGVGELPRVASATSKRRKRCRSPPVEVASEPRRLQYISPGAALAISHVVAPLAHSVNQSNEKLTGKEKGCVVTQRSSDDSKGEKVIFDSGSRGIVLVNNEVLLLKVKESKSKVVH
jgi:hypothetical protein